MLTMIGIILAFIGVILLVVALAVGLGSSNPTDQLGALIMGLLGGGMTFFGAIAFVAGIVMARKQRDQAKLISETGVTTDATVTFVDRNYKILVNEQPIYFIVEFTFRDTSGMERVVRYDTVDSELVIRNKVEVGSTVKVKYLAEDPTQTLLLLEDPRTTT